MVNPMDHPLRNRLVLITGGGRGIGRVYAEHLASKGARMVLAARSADELDDVASAIEADGGSASSYPVDVTDAVAVRHLIDRVEDEKGPIDVLINNAGTRGPIANAWECQWEEWWQAIQVNLGGAAAFSHAVIPRMAARRRGTVVNIVSEAGVYRWPTLSAYSVSKAALIKFSENVALECRDVSVSVFAYHPGLLPIGLATEAMNVPASATLAEARVAAWFRAQLNTDAAASPEASARQLVSLLSGAYDGLTGRYISVHDDLDLLVERVGNPVAAKDYRMLRAGA
ncbi:MAG TPA: SDR family oxidoreductase [Luteibacter sp.]|uniref:SDR family NAD(P)-dependent oxidoreductase n=1 Tax=Luteibacter sp. TaxID=1886636 RepID=UPI002CFA7C6C|nr:SDR family oxidoreductase [Luteibacter sp.]HVI56350.1 SDR family oxidoreductase [Luteibacter sp.]